MEVMWDSHRSIVLRHKLITYLNLWFAFFASFAYCYATDLHFTYLLTYLLTYYMAYWLYALLVKCMARIQNDCCIVWWTTSVMCYNLRKRTGNNKTLIEKTVDLNDRDFLIRNFYKYSYWLVFLSSIAIMYFLAFYCFFMFLLFFYSLPIYVIKLRMSTYNKRTEMMMMMMMMMYR